MYRLRKFRICYRKKRSIKKLYKKIMLMDLIVAELKYQDIMWEGTEPPTLEGRSLGLRK